MVAPSANAPTRMTDEALMARYQESLDQTAFALLLDRYRHKIHDAVYHLGLFTSDDDLVQDTFVLVHLNRHRFDPSISSFKCWLLRIATNVAKKQCRSKSRRTSRVCDLPDDLEVADEHVGDPEERAGLDEMRALVRDKVSLLRPKFREAIECVYFLGLTKQETAERLGITKHQTNCRLRQAIAQLTTMLIGPEGRDEDLRHFPTVANLR